MLSGAADPPTCPKYWARAGPGPISEASQKTTAATFALLIRCPRFRGLGVVEAGPIGARWVAGIGRDRAVGDGQEPLVGQVEVAADRPEVVPPEDPPDRARTRVDLEDPSRGQLPDPVGPDRDAARQP